MFFQHQLLVLHLSMFGVDSKHHIMYFSPFWVHADFTRIWLLRSGLVTFFFLLCVFISGLAYRFIVSSASIAFFLLAFLFLILAYFASVYLFATYQKTLLFQLSIFVKMRKYLKPYGRNYTRSATDRLLTCEISSLEFDTEENKEFQLFFNGQTQSTHAWKEVLSKTLKH